MGALVAIGVYVIIQACTNVSSWIVVPTCLAFGIVSIPYMFDSGDNEHTFKAGLYLIIPFVPLGVLAIAQFGTAGWVVTSFLWWFGQRWLTKSLLRGERVS